jgi:rRNA-processing protein FCF1
MSLTGGDMVTKVVLDTNALMMPFQFNINLDIELERLLGPFEGIVPTSVLEELEGMKPERLAKAARALASKYEVFETDEKGDTAIVSVAEKLRAVVVTNDKALGSKLKALKLPVVSLRSRARLVLSGSFL